MDKKIIVTNGCEYKNVFTFKNILYALLVLVLFERMQINLIKLKYGTK